MQLNDVLQARRSVRRYESAVFPAEEMRAIVAAALEAPSWKNFEPTRYHAVIDPAAVARFREETLPSFNQLSTANAAAYVVVTFKRGVSGFSAGTNGVPVPDNELGDMWGAYDAGLASSYFILAAKDRGWDSLILGLRDIDRIRESLAIPEDETITAIIALGKGAVTPVKPPRKPVADVLRLH